MSQNDIMEKIVHPIMDVLEGKSATESMAALTLIVAMTLHQMIPDIGRTATFDGAMDLFKKQVKDDVVSLIEQNKK